MSCFPFECKSMTYKNSPTQFCSSLPKSQSFLRCSSSSSSSSIITTPTIQKLSYSVGDLIDSGALSERYGALCKSSENPNSVLSFLQSCGFSKTQVETIVSKYPRILFCKAQKTLKPKIDFLRSVGLSEADVLNMVTTSPRLLNNRSLKNHLVPSFDCLIISLGSQQEAVSTIKRYPYLLSYNLSENLAPNLSTLRNFGIPESQISKMMTGLITNQVIAGTKPKWFRKVVSDVMEMGFDPSLSTFEYAINVMGFQRESTWEGKLAFYKSLGFSGDEILFMFRKSPSVLSMPEEKIRATVEFYVDNFHCSPSQLSKSSHVLTYSLEKRIIPRCLVLQVLVSRNRICHKIKLSSILTKTESNFLQRYVIKYKDEIPELLDVYQGKMKPSECNFDSEEMRWLSDCQILI